MRGFTVEMSFLAPLMLLLIMSSVFGIFYFHDKNIIEGAAYETVAVGAGKAREKGMIDEGGLKKLFEERVGDKCILFDGAAATVRISDEIEILAEGEKRGMNVSVIKRMPVTKPEQKIRDMRRMKGLGNGTNDNN